MLRPFSFFLALSVISLPISHVLAQQSGSDAAIKQLYRSCLSQARKDPEEGLRRALDWQADGGGIAARHCEALALLNLDRPDEAARKIEELVDEAEPKDRVMLLAQAGQAWFQASLPEKTVEVISRAIKLAPNHPDLLLDRAIAYADQELFWDALTDLQLAQQLAPQRADILIYRASAYRHLDTPELAADDLERALTLSPGNPEALLERGLVRQTLDDKNGARADWLKVITSHPGTPAAQAAELHLQRMDLDAG